MLNDIEPINFQVWYILEPQVEKTVIKKLRIGNNSQTDRQGQTDNIQTGWEAWYKHSISTLSANKKVGKGDCTKIIPQNISIFAVWKTST